jgi:hypothetical protein
MQLLQFSLCFVSIEVVFTLSEEFLLRNIKELLISEAECAFHFCDLLPQLIILVLNRCEIVNTVVSLLSGRTLHRECV